MSDETQQLVDRLESAFAQLKHYILSGKYGMALREIMAMSVEVENAARRNGE